MPPVNWPRLPSSAILRNCSGCVNSGFDCSFSAVICAVGIQRVAGCEIPGDPARLCRPMHPPLFQSQFRLWPAMALFQKAVKRTRQRLRASIKSRSDGPPTCSADNPSSTKCSPLAGIPQRERCHSVQRYPAVRELCHTLVRSACPLCNACFKIIVHSRRNLRSGRNIASLTGAQRFLGSLSLVNVVNLVQQIPVSLPFDIGEQARNKVDKRLIQCRAGKRRKLIRAPEDITRSPLRKPGRADRRSLGRHSRHASRTSGPTNSRSLPAF